MIRQQRQFGISFAIGLLVCSVAGDCFAQIFSDTNVKNRSKEFRQDDGLLISPGINGRDSEVYDHQTNHGERLDPGLGLFPLIFEPSDLNCGQITAGQLWEYFHQQGKTSVDRLKFDLICNSTFETDRSDFGMFRFQVEGADGGMLSSFNLIAANGTLEVPLDYDYMKRFSRDSQEIIRFHLPSDGPFSLSNTQISVASDAPAMGSKNLFYLFGFCGFWIIVFVILNRFTKPIDESSEEIKILSNPHQLNMNEASADKSISDVSSVDENSKLVARAAVKADPESASCSLPNTDAAYRKVMDHQPQVAAGVYIPSR